MKNKFSGLSLRRDKHFIRNLVIAIGVVLVRRGVWHLADEYLFPNDQLFSSVVSLIVGILILYLPDGHWNISVATKKKISQKRNKKTLQSDFI